MTYKILLIDDDPNLLPSMVTLLEELTDFTIITAADGMVGLERAFTERPDCIVVDVRMPELNGYQFVKAMRGDPETADVPMIILSALVQERDKWIGLASGVDRYLTKPVDAMELIAIINEVVQLTAQDRIAQLRELDLNGWPEG